MRPQTTHVDYGLSIEDPTRIRKGPECRNGKWYSGGWLLHTTSFFFFFLVLGSAFPTYNTEDIIIQYAKKGLIDNG